MTKILFKLSKIPCNIYSIEYVGRKILRGQGNKFCHKIFMAEVYDQARSMFSLSCE